MLTGAGDIVEEEEFKILFITRDLQEEVRQMPYRDGTGPEGRGAMTGKAQGNCTGAARPRTGFFGQVGRWFGFGSRGRGRGMVSRRNTSGLINRR